MHGMPWYARTNSPLLRCVLLLASTAVISALVAVIIKQAVIYSRDDTVRNAVEWRTARAIAYPNITVCNAKFFEKTRLEGT